MSRDTAPKASPNLGPGTGKALLPQPLWKALAPSRRGARRVRFGRKEAVVGVEPARPARWELCLSPEVASGLGIPEGEPLGVAVGPEGEVRLGPVVGVFLSRGGIRRLGGGPHHFRIVELVKAAQATGCFVYFFSITDVDWPHRTISGHHYSWPSNRWEQRGCPFPDVLYDRAGGFTRRQRPVAQYIRGQFDLCPEVRRLNAQHHFDKWEVHCRLSRHPELLPHLPETALYSSPADIAGLLARFGTVYLKSREGSNGREVMRVASAPGGLRYDYFRERNVTAVASGLKELEGVVREFFAGEGFIVQQGIDVATVDGSNTDLRALMQRDGAGRWRLTGAPVRVGVAECAITSTQTGARVYTLDRALAGVFGCSRDAAAELKEAVRRLSFLVAELVEQEYGVFGELGIDLAVDKQGQLWFIEVNAKPGKDTVMLAGDPEEVRQAFRLPLEYCRHLAGFTEGPALGPVVVTVGKR